VLANDPVGLLRKFLHRFPVAQVFKAKVWAECFGLGIQVTDHQNEGIISMTLSSSIINSYILEVRTRPYPGARGK
jgi:hypothetical protein